MLTLLVGAAHHLRHHRVVRLLLRAVAGRHLLQLALHVLGGHVLQRVLLLVLLVLVVHCY